MRSVLFTASPSSIRFAFPFACIPVLYTWLLPVALELPVAPSARVYHFFDLTVYFVAGSALWRWEKSSRRSRKKRVLVYRLRRGDFSISVVKITRKYNHLIVLIPRSIAKAVRNSVHFLKLTKFYYCSIANMKRIFFHLGSLKLNKI